MEGFLHAQGLIILLVLVATLVAIVVRRIRFPYTVSLVLVGLFLSVQRPLDVEVTPELILAIFVPPLIFEAAFHLDFSLLRENLTPILVLAVPGVALTTLIVGGIVAAGTGMDLGAASVFGALIAATDPVAVIALFRALGVSRRLAVALEGESLFNDGTAIVLFRIALAAALSGYFSPVEGLFDFTEVALGGIAIGTALGWLTAQLIARLEDRLVVTTLTTLLAYGAYLSAEQLHVSGVLAVVMAGLVCGNVGLAGASPTTKIMLFNLWEYLAFLANSLVFLLIGLTVDLAQLATNLGPIGVAVAAVLISRVVVVYGLSWLAHAGRSRPHIPLRWRHVLFWGGLRGAISLALALSLPAVLPERETLQAMAFGVMLFTLLGQGTTIHFLLRKLGLISLPQHRLAREKRLGRLFAAQAGLRRLERLHREGLLTDEMWAGLRDDYHQARQRLIEEMNRLFREHAELEREMLIQARREALQAERGALGDALRRGLISTVVYEELTEEVDRRLEALEMIQAALHGERAGELERDGA
ncbi:MAG TPA: Na+/H+ antiporter [Thermoflexia bacterium]|nr:Na+/H+ antiporter [Thermoflexia bacterium]